MPSTWNSSLSEKRIFKVFFFSKRTGVDKNPAWDKFDFFYMNSFNYIPDESALFNEHLSIKLLPVWSIYGKLSWRKSQDWLKEPKTALDHSSVNVNFMEIHSLCFWHRLISTAFLFYTHLATQVNSDDNSRTELLFKLISHY